MIFIYRNFDFDYLLNAIFRSVIFFIETMINTYEIVTLMRHIFLSEWSKKKLKEKIFYKNQSCIIIQMKKDLCYCSFNSKPS